jgi:hypothetical protein
MDEVGESISENPLTRWRVDTIHLLRTETAVALGSLITKRVPLACPVLTFALRLWLLVKRAKKLALLLCGSAGC